MTTIRIKNKSKKLNSIRRRKTAHLRKCDIEDPYHVGKPGTFSCLTCGSPTEPYKQDALGDIIVSCTNACCIKNKEFENSITVQLAKLLKEQQLHSRYYMDYFGGHYGKSWNPWRAAGYE